VINENRCQLNRQQTPKSHRRLHADHLKPLSVILAFCLDYDAAHAWLFYQAPIGAGD
jgi:hypothetical protein